MKTYLEWAGMTYRISRTKSGQTSVFKLVERESTLGGKYLGWDHLCGREGDREAARLMERVAIESLGLTENTFVKVLSEDPAAAG